MTRIATLVIGLAVLRSDAAFGQNSSYGVAAIALDARAADKTVELGAGTLRLAFPWNVIEADCKGCFNWTFTDEWRDEARRTHRTIYGLLAYTPQWANGNQTYNYPPLNYGDWYDFVYAIAARYREDILHWGIWNEPNLNHYLHGTDLKVYQELVTTARAAILSANPDAYVLGPEVSWHAVRSGWFAAAMSSFGHLFDMVTVHWYPDGPQLEYMMDELVRPFSRGRDVWLSETGSKPCTTILGEGAQASFYRRVLAAFLRRRAWWTTVIFYNVHEEPKPRDCGFGITRQDWSNRPAFSLYQAFIRQNP